jgi:hypothetical protein
MKTEIISIFAFTTFFASCELTPNPSGNNDLFDIVHSEENEDINPPQKQIEWSNGNFYSYDYIETISKIDSSGNEFQIIVYKQNPPNENNIICEKKVCNWCGKEVSAENYEIQEYPNINWLRGQPDLTSIFGMFAAMFEGKEYYDLDNNRIRTEWRIDCSYPGPNGFCSLKCENDYQYR